jgi:ABC-type polysaccharide/polyol phosphate transport system ATPase subunit
LRERGYDERTATERITKYRICIYAEHDDAIVEDFCDKAMVPEETGRFQTDEATIRFSKMHYTT